MQHPSTPSTVQIQKKGTKCLKWIQNWSPLQRGACSLGRPLELADVRAGGQDCLGAGLHRRVTKAASILPFALRPEAADSLDFLRRKILDGRRLEPAHWGNRVRTWCGDWGEGPLHFGLCRRVLSSCD